MQKLNIKAILGITILGWAALTYLGNTSITSESLLRDSRSFLNQGLSSPAMELLKKVQWTEPEYATAQQLLTTIYLDKSDFEQAKQQAETLLAEPEKNARLLMDTAHLYNQHGYEQEAIALLNQIKVPTEAEHIRLSLIAQSYAQLRSLKKSEQHFENALLHAPQSPMARLGLAQLYLLSNRQQQGNDALRAFMSDNPMHTGAHFVQLRYQLANNNTDIAIELLKKIIAIDTHDANARYIMGLLYLSRGQFSNVQRVAYELNPDTNTLSSSQNNISDKNKDIALRLESLIALHHGQFESAIDGLNTSLNSLPDLPGFVFAAVAHYQTRDYTNAYAKLHRALLINRLDERANTLMAFTLFKMKKFEKSLYLANSAIKQYPDNALLHNIIGANYIEQGQFDLANHHMRMALTLDRNLVKQPRNQNVYANLDSFSQPKDLSRLLPIHVNPAVEHPRVLIALNDLMSGNPELAAKKLESWLQDKTTQPFFYYLLAQTFENLHDDEQAMTYLRLARESKRDFVGPRLVIAQKFIEQEAYTLAEQEYKSIIHDAPSNVLAYLKLASLYELLGFMDEADEIYHAIGTPENVSANIALAGFLSRTGRAQESIASLRTALHKNPNNFHLIKALGEALVSAGEFKAAQQMFRQLDQIQPGSALPLIVSTLLQQREIEEADNLVTHVFEESSCSELAYLLKANIHEYKGELVKAQAMLNDGIRTCERQTVSTLKLKLAELLYKQSQYSNAQRIYDELLTENPANIKALFFKGVVSSLSGEKQRAARFYSNVLEINPDYAPALNNLAFLKCSEFKDCKTGLALATKAFSLMPENHQTSHTLGLVYLNIGAPKKAVIFLQKAVALAPENAVYAALLGKAQAMSEVTDKQSSFAGNTL